MEAHEQVPEVHKVGSMTELLGENVSTVYFSRNVFDLDYTVLLLAFVDKVFSDNEMLEAFCNCCFGPVAA